MTPAEKKYTTALVASLAVLAGAVVGSGRSRDLTGQIRDERCRPLVAFDATWWGDERLSR